MNTDFAKYTTESSRLEGTKQNCQDETSGSQELSAVDKRSRRLATLQKAIEAGAYRIPSARLADCLKRRMLEAR